DKVDKEKKEREAAMAAQRKDVKQPSSHEVPSIEETATAPKPEEKAKPAVKHDDAFVDKLLKNDKPFEKRKSNVNNDEVHKLRAKAKEDKPAVVKSKRGDTVDALLASADKQPTIKTTAPKPAATSEPVSAEAAARDAALKAIQAAQAARAEE